MLELGTPSPSSFARRCSAGRCCSRCRSRLAVALSRTADVGVQGSRLVQRSMANFGNFAGYICSVMF